MQIRIRKPGIFCFLFNVMMLCLWLFRVFFLKCANAAYFICAQVDAMSPLIDAELERVDRRHAQLTRLRKESSPDYRNHYVVTRIKRTVS
jgi:hypothetical protein